MKRIALISLLIAGSLSVGALANAEFGTVKAEKVVTTDLVVERTTFLNNTVYTQGSIVGPTISDLYERIHELEERVSELEAAAPPGRR